MWPGLFPIHFGAGLDSATPSCICSMHQSLGECISHSALNYLQGTRVSVDRPLWYPSRDFSSSLNMRFPLCLNIFPDGRKNKMSRKVNTYMIYFNVPYFPMNICYLGDPLCGIAN